MRHLGAVVQGAALPVLDTGQDLALRRGVAAQLVGRDDPRHILQALEQFAEEPLGGLRTAPALHQYVQHVAVLVHGPPEVMRLAADAEEHLVKMPFVAWLRATPLQRVGEQPAKTQRSLADALVEHHHAAGGQDGLDVAQAEAEAVIQSHRVLDHLGREAEAAVGIG